MKLLIVLLLAGTALAQQTVYSEGGAWLPNDNQHPQGTWLFDGPGTVTFNKPVVSSGANTWTGAQTLNDVALGVFENGSLSSPALTWKNGSGAGSFYATGGNYTTGAMTIVKPAGASSALDITEKDNTGFLFRVLAPNQFSPVLKPGFSIDNGTNVLVSTSVTVSGHVSFSNDSWITNPPSVEPFMIACWSDIVGPCIMSRTNTGAAGEYNYGAMDNNGNHVFSVENDGSTMYGTGTRSSMLDMGGLTDLTATASMTAGQVVKLDTANANSVVVTVTTDTGAGVPLGVVVNSPGAAGTAHILIDGQTNLTVLGTGTCTVGQFVIVDTTTNGRVKCTSTYAAGTIIGKALTAQASVGSALTVLVHTE